ncbi:MAG: OB-fold nucleic acid binding domain-containing protein [Candidatus Methanofastidiosa archaeon]|nr:OB-fold nucleic acid binding domain-containing protein [Candidatus Methanofastidiosa archaeon]
MVAARKLRIKDIVIGKLELTDDSNNILVSNFGNNDEVRICGTVVNRFISDDGNYGNLLIDDGSESILTKFWRADVSRLKGFDRGDFVDVVAGVKEYKDEKYLQPVHLFKCDIHDWIEFQLEVALGIKELVESGEWKELPVYEDLANSPFDDDEVQVAGHESKYDKDIDDSFEEESIIFDDDDINRAVLESIDKNPMTKDEIIKKTMLDEIDVMLSIKELLESGDIFEVDGKYKRS